MIVGIIIMVGRVLARVLHNNGYRSCVRVTPPAGVVSGWLTSLELRKWHTGSGQATPEYAFLDRWLASRYRTIESGPVECGGDIYLHLLNRGPPTLVRPITSQLLSSDDNIAVVELRAEDAAVLDWELRGYTSPAEFLRGLDCEHKYGCRRLLSYQRYGKVAVFTGKLG